MRILWLTWKGYTHPQAGGAEVVLRELGKRMVADGHQLTILTSGYPGAPDREHRDGIQFIRIGHDRHVHPFLALGYYLRRLRNKFDVLIEEVNAAPYFAVLFERRARTFLLYHQMERQVWFYEAKPPLSYIGHYLLEPAATRILALSRTPVITISESTRADLARHGISPERTKIISEGIEIDPVPDITAVQKYERPTVLSLGAMRAMKRTCHQIKAFELAKRHIPDLQLKIAGKADGAYGQEVMKTIGQSPHRQDIEYLGMVSREFKAELMQKSHLTLQTAIHEGWGLTITEAASQGTPAVVYDVNGLRDSVRHGQTGYIAAQKPEALAEGIVRVLSDDELYEAMRRKAWQWSKTINFERSYADFRAAVGIG